MLLFLATPPALALNLEVGAGVACGQISEDGIWYQQRFPHSPNLCGNYASIGITDKMDVWGRDVRWRVYGFYMGSFTNDAEAVQDEHYAPQSPTGCTSDGCGQFSLYQSILSVRGVAVTFAPEFRPFAMLGKPVIVSPEIGIALYQNKMDVEVYTLDSNSPASSHRSYQYKWGKNFGEVFGVGVEWGNVRLSIKRMKINARTEANGDFRTEVPLNTGELINVAELNVRF